MLNQADIRNALRGVIDPELGIDVIELGMVGAVEILDGAEVLVNMRLTSMSCPFWELFTDQVRSAVGELEGVGRVVVQFDRTQAWSPDRMTPGARNQLEAIGLMPPAAARQQCAHTDRGQLLQIAEGVLGAPFRGGRTEP
jgi:metal-sulfur cluster biosynthetic enzyme